MVEGDVYLDYEPEIADKSTDDEAEIPPVQQFATAAAIPVATAVATAEDPNETETAPPGRGMVGGMMGGGMGGGMMGGGMGASDQGIK